MWGWAEIVSAQPPTIAIMSRLFSRDVRTFQLRHFTAQRAALGLASRYLSLVEDRTAGTAIFERIRTGWKQTCDGLLGVTGQSRLLERTPQLDASVRLRLPYIEPLNLLQIELIRRLRGGEADARVADGIQLSINAIATALRNSG